MKKKLVDLKWQYGCCCQESPWESFVLVNKPQPWKSIEEYVLKLASARCCKKCLHGEIFCSMTSPFEAFQYLSCIRILFPFAVMHALCYVTIGSDVGFQNPRKTRLDQSKIYQNSNQNPSKNNQKSIKYPSKIDPKSVKKCPKIDQNL